MIAPVPPATANPYQTETMLPPSQLSPSLSSPGTGKLVTALPVREAGQAGLGFSTFRSETPAQVSALEQASPIPQLAYAEPTIAGEAPAKLATAYPQTSPGVKSRRLNVPLLLLLGLVLFVLFFVVGFFLAHTFLFPH